MKLIILDRDGVINQDSDAYVKSVGEWIPIDGSIDAIVSLYKAGFTIAVATNQSGLGRGMFSLQTLEAMHQKMNDLVNEQGGEIATVVYCPHHPDDHCYCRKPKPGLISAIENTLGLSAKGAILVGDSLRDLQAGVSKGCKPYLVKTGKGEKTLTKLQENDPQLLKDTLVFNNLADIAKALTL